MRITEKTITPTTGVQRTPLNQDTIKTINGTKYIVHSIYAGSKDFRQVFTDLVVEKTVRRLDKKDGAAA